VNEHRRAAQGMLADPAAYFARQREIRQQEAEQHVTEQLTKRHTERPPLLIPWSLILAIVVFVFALGFLGYALGYAWTMNSVR